MHAAGVSVARMAVRLGVSTRSVRWYLECLGLRVPARKPRRSALIELWQRAMAGDVHYLHTARERSRDELRELCLGELRGELARLEATGRCADDVRLALSLWEADEAWRRAS